MYLVPSSCIPNAILWSLQADNIPETKAKKGHSRQKDRDRGMKAVDQTLHRDSHHILKAPHALEASTTPGAIEEDDSGLVGGNSSERAYNSRKRGSGGKGKAKAAASSPQPPALPAELDSASFPKETSNRGRGARRPGRRQKEVTSLDSGHSGHQNAVLGQSRGVTSRTSAQTEGVTGAPSLGTQSSSHEETMASRRGPPPSGASPNWEATLGNNGQARDEAENLVGNSAGVGTEQRGSREGRPKRGRERGHSRRDKALVSTNTSQGDPAGGYSPAAAPNDLKGVAESSYPSAPPGITLPNNNSGSQAIQDGAYHASSSSGPVERPIGHSPSGRQNGLSKAQKGALKEQEQRIKSVPLGDTEIGRCLRGKTMSRLCV